MFNTIRHFFLNVRVFFILRYITYYIGYYKRYIIFYCLSTHFHNILNQTTFLHISVYHKSVSKRINEIERIIWPLSETTDGQMFSVRRRKEFYFMLEVKYFDDFSSHPCSSPTKQKHLYVSLHHLISENYVYLCAHCCYNFALSAVNNKVIWWNSGCLLSCARFYFCLGLPCNNTPEEVVSKEKNAPD